MGFRSTVVLPEEMSAERFEKIRAYGADVIATPGCESNVKEIYDKVNELKRDPQNKILNQFAEFGNYRFHYHVTGHAAAEVTQSLGNQKVAAFVSAMGSAGTIAAGDFLKQRFGNTAIVGVEPIQCPTLYNVGFGGHRIEGIGDKHVTWIHNVGNMDLLVCIDDIATLRGLQLLQDGGEVLMEALGLNEETIKSFSGVFGMSGICNVLAAIKTAKFYGLGKDDNVLTLATDGFDRYPSVMAELDKVEGAMDREKALRRIELFHRTSLDYILEGSREVQRRWHNQKYFTWVEQQGKSVEDLNALFDSDFWIGEHEKIAGLDKAWANARNG